MAISIHGVALSIIYILVGVCIRNHGVSSEDTYRVGCYMNYWSGSVAIEDMIDPKICTHVFYAFVEIYNGGLRADQADSNFGSNIRKLKALRDAHPDMKVLASVGGGAAGGVPFLQVSSDAVKLSEFALKAGAFIRAQGLDGLDIDWEAEWCYDEWDPDQQAALLQSLHAEFKKEGETELLLTAAVLPILSYTNYTKSEEGGCVIVDSTPMPFYHAETLNSALDFANIMAYDLRGDWNDVTGCHAALYPPNDNVDDIVQGFTDMGLHPSRMQLGIPFYGRSYKLDDIYDYGVGDETTGAGVPVTPAFSKICNDVKSNGWTRKYDNENKCPYAYKDKDWVGFEDTKSISEKVRYMKAKSMGGLVFWSMEMDDLTGHCGAGKAPLANTAYNELYGVTTVRATTSRSTNAARGAMRAGSAVAITSLVFFICVVLKP